MKLLARILGGPGHWYVIGILVCIGHTTLAIQSWRGERFALGVMIVMLYIWSALAIMNGVGRGKSLRGWERSLDNWNESSELAHDYARLLSEACTALSTWDREQADDIVERATTIGRLRQANVRERSEND